MPSWMLLGILHFYLCNTILCIYIRPYMQSVCSPIQEELSVHAKNDVGHRFC